MTNKSGGAGVGDPDNPLKGAVYTEKYLFKVGKQGCVEIWTKNRDGKYIDRLGVAKETLGHLIDAANAAYNIANDNRRNIGDDKLYKRFVVAAGLLIGVDDDDQAAWPPACLWVRNIKTIEHDMSGNVVVVGPDHWTITFIKEAMPELVNQIWGGKNV